MNTMRIRRANSRLHRPLAPSVVGPFGPMNMMRSTQALGGILGHIGCIGLAPFCGWRFRTDENDETTRFKIKLVLISNSQAT